MKRWALPMRRWSSLPRCSKEKGGMSYIGGGMYDVETCPERGALMWNGRCENLDCIYHWRPKTDEDDSCQEDEG